MWSQKHLYCNCGYSLGYEGCWLDCWGVSLSPQHSLLQAAHDCNRISITYCHLYNLGGQGGSLLYINIHNIRDISGQLPHCVFPCFLPSGCCGGGGGGGGGCVVCVLGEGMMGGALLAAGKGVVWCVGFPCSHQISPFHYQLSHNNACTRILSYTWLY